MRAASAGDASARTDGILANPSANHDAFDDDPSLRLCLTVCSYVYGANAAPVRGTKAGARIGYRRFVLRARNSSSANAAADGCALDDDEAFSAASRLRSDALGWYPVRRRGTRAAGASAAAEFSPVMIPRTAASDVHLFSNSRDAISDSRATRVFTSAAAAAAETSSDASPAIS